MPEQSALERSLTPDVTAPDPAAQHRDDQTARVAPADAADRSPEHGPAPLARAVAPAPAPDVPRNGALPSAYTAPRPTSHEPAVPDVPAPFEPPVALAGAEPRALPTLQRAFATSRGESVARPAHAADAVALPIHEAPPAPRIEPGAAESAGHEMVVEVVLPGAPPVVTREAGAGAWSTVAPITRGSPVEQRLSEPRPRVDDAGAMDMRPLARSVRAASDSRGFRDERAAPATRSLEADARGRSSRAHGPVPAAAEAKGVGTTVEVSIGRIEVRVAPRLRAEPSSVATPARPAVDLGEYLRRREQG
jgi:hypothetical protein